MTPSSAMASSFFCFSFFMIKLRSLSKKGKLSEVAYFLALDKQRDT